MRPRRAPASNGVRRISAFYSIVSCMYHDEIQHPGRPNFHARYGNDEASIEIEALTSIETVSTARRASRPLARDSPGEGKRSQPASVARVLAVEGDRADGSAGHCQSHDCGSAPIRCRLLACSNDVGGWMFSDQLAVCARSPTMCACGDGVDGQYRVSSQRFDHPGQIERRRGRCPRGGVRFGGAAGQCGDG